MADFGRFKRDVAGFIKTVMSRVDYQALYPARVVSQNADGTLELIPDDARWSGFSNVPIRYGVPGVSAVVAPSSRVLLGFENGDPSFPVATLWQNSTVTTLNVTATNIVLNGGTAKVARVNDLVVMGSLTSAWVTAVNTALSGSGTASKVPGLTAPTDFGVISSGANGVKA